MQISYERGDPAKWNTLPMPDLFPTKYLVGYGQEQGEVVTRYLVTHKS